MREILFRGKRSDNGEWVEGYFCHCIRELNGGKTYLAIQQTDDNSLFFREVDHDTIGQYTGLTDKNGRKIFEGDVLKIEQIGNGLGDYYMPPLPYPVNVVVKWDLCAWTWETLCEDKRYIRFFPDAWCHFRCEVIGNIHDNPDCVARMDGDEE